jgi:hypothetical protein
MENEIKILKTKKLIAERWNKIYERKIELILEHNENMFQFEADNEQKNKISNMKNNTLLNLIKENEKILDNQFWTISNRLTGEEYSDFKEFFNNAQLKILEHIVELKEPENWDKWSMERQFGYKLACEEILSPLRVAIKELKE